MNLEGLRFGRLRVIQRHYCADRHNSYWECVCDCGKITYPLGNSLKRGLTKSCGLCARAGQQTLPNTAKLGLRLISVCHNCRGRCNNPNAECFHNYGGRGIQFKFSNPREMAEWIVDNIGHRPSPLFSLDRINNNGHYEAGNLRWASRREQRLNQRKKASLSSFSDEELRVELSRRDTSVK